MIGGGGPIKVLATSKIIKTLASGVETILQFLRNNQVLVVILFLSVVMRFFLMDWISYWYDELLSVYIRGITFGNSYELLEYYRDQGRATPLYEFLLYNWMQIFGHTEVATRSLSTLFVVLSVIFLYFFTMRIYGRRIAIATILFYNFSYMALYYSLEARYYGLTLFLCTLSSYLLLLYIESLKGTYSWKNLFLNSYFGLLVITNVALMLNHLTNYMFIAAQVFFMLFYFLYRNRSESFVLTIIKVTALYTTQLIVMFIIWDFTLLRLLLGNFEPILILYMLGFAVVAVALIYLFIYFYRRKLDYKPEWQKLTYMFLGLGFAAGFIYILQAVIEINIINLLLIEPIFYFMVGIVLPNLKVSTISIIFIMFLAYFLLINHGVRSFQQNFCDASLDRKLFFIYILIWLVLPAFLMPIILFIGIEDFIAGGVVRPRYFIFCTPPLMLILVLILEQGVKLFDHLSKRFSGISLWNHYIRNAMLYALIGLLVLVIPVSYNSVTQYKHDIFDWGGITKQIVNLIREDPDNRYVIYETSPTPDPLLDYYLARYSDNIRVYDNILRHEEEKLSSGDSYVAGFEKDENKIKHPLNDYLIVVFTHETKYTYPVVLERLSEMYKLHFKQIDRDLYNRGFIVYKIHDKSEAEKEKPVGLSFSGEGNYVDLEFSPQFALGDSFTFEFWVKLLEEADQATVLFGSNPVEQSAYGFFTCEQDGISFGLHTEGGQAGVSFREHQLNKWYHLAGVYDGTERKVYLYLDGVLIGTADLDGEITSLSPGQLGFNMPGTFNSLRSEPGHTRCIKYDAKLWGAARTQQQIKEDMFRSLDGTEENLIGYWPLDEGEGAIVHDLTVNNNHGNITGAKWNYINE